MEIGAIFLLLIVLVIVFLFVARPFVGKVKRSTDKGHELSSLLAEQDRVLTALQELDFDNLLGKIPAEEYPLQRQELLGKGTAVMRRLDELQDMKPGSAEARQKAAGVYRQADAAKRTVLSDEDLEDLIAKRRSSRKEKTGGFCPHCGKPVLLSDRFCPSCGKPLK
jgi:rubrerythrin